MKHLVLAALIAMIPLSGHADSVTVHVETWGKGYICVSDKESGMQYDLNAPLCQQALEKYKANQKSPAKQAEFEHLQDNVRKDLKKFSCHLGKPVVDSLNPALANSLIDVVLERIDFVRLAKFKDLYCKDHNFDNALEKSMQSDSPSQGQPQVSTGAGIDT